MSDFATELRACLGFVLGETPPPADIEPVAFFKQWLGARNLGLVPIDEPSTFSWPGYWIGVTRDLKDEHAVVMYGAPSALVFQPSGWGATDAIQKGWLLAQFDLQLGINRPYEIEPGVGTVVGIYVAAQAGALPDSLDYVEAVTGRGLRGDRYFDGRGTFSSPGRGFQLTLVEAEVLDEVGLEGAAARRNIVTDGVRLNGLVGRRFRIGEVECIGRRLDEPCAHLERLTERRGLIRPLIHRAGLRADIVNGGTVSLGDPLTAIA